MLASSPRRKGLLCSTIFELKALHLFILNTVPILAAVPVAPNKKFLVYPSGSYGVSGSQQPQNTNFDQNLSIGAL